MSDPTFSDIDLKNKMAWVLTTLSLDRESQRVACPDYQTVNWHFKIFTDNVYIGDYDSFFDAREQELPYTWLKLEPPSQSREEQMVRNHIPSYLGGQIFGPAQILGEVTSACRLVFDPPKFLIKINNHVIESPF